jgi:hypothetical protein
MARIQTLSGMKARNESFPEFTRRVVFASAGKEANMLYAWISQVELCNTAKEKGDLFEDLCVCYLLHPRKDGGAGMRAAWRLPSLPDRIRGQLLLPKRDYGIDIVAVDGAGNFHAVQAKFKGRSSFRPNKYRSSLKVAWREISTFLALARRGNYLKHWVVTTADGVTRAGGATAQDASVCYRSLRRLPASFWQAISGMKGQRLSDTGNPLEHKAPERLRQLRGEYFAKFRGGKKEEL